MVITSYGLVTGPLVKVAFIPLKITKAKMQWHAMIFMLSVGGFYQSSN